MNRTQQKIITSFGIAAITLGCGINIAIANHQNPLPRLEHSANQTNTINTQAHQENSSSNTESAKTKQPVIETKTEAQTKEIPFITKYVDDNTLAKGTTKTAQNGVAGIETTTYSVTYTDGKETARKVVKVEVTKKPIGQIIARGTYVAPKPTTTATSPSAQNCNIKGNISKSGEKIYHMPGQRYYSKTIINTSAGERWFCSEAEARAAGWRKSKV